MISKLNKIIFSLIAYMLLVSSAVAKCDFGIKIGENISDKFEGEYGIANKIAEEENIHEEENIYAENNGIQFIYFDANKICNTSSLKDIEIEFTVLYDELASIRMTAINDEKNIPTKKFTLMKYAKSNYGDFDTGFDPETFNDFYHWRKNKSLVIYSRTINKDNIWDEEIYITNDRYEEAINLALSGEIEIKNSNE